jgi:ribosomal protein S18 acetylase RimI-like enzyme
MNEISYEEIGEFELSQIAEIDRQEEIRVGYQIQSGKLISSDVHWDVPPFTIEGSGEHTFSRQINFCRQHLIAGAKAIGAFSRDKLVGIIVVTPEIRPQIAQIAYLLVGQGFRRKGIASELFQLGQDLAQAAGAEQLYVSATPSESAVGFYRQLGFELVSNPLTELYKLEPDDIHMIKTL